MFEAIISGEFFNTQFLDESPNFEYVTAKDSTRQQIQYGGLHSISTPYGTLDCIKNRLIFPLSDSVIFDRYYAKGLGMVKEDRYYMVDGKASSGYILELTGVKF